MNDVLTMLKHWQLDVKAVRKEFARAANKPAALFSFNSRGACPKCKGLGTIAVEMSYDPPEYVRQFAEKNGLPFTVALDPDGAVAQAFGNVRVTPTTFVIDRQGQIIQQYVGEPDFAKLHALIESVL